MRYTKTVDFNGNVPTAFAVVTGALTASGFRLTAQDGRRLQFTRGISCIGRDGQMSLRSVSEINVTASSRQLSLEAESGGVRRTAAWIVAPLAAVVIAIAAAVEKAATRATPWNADKLLQIAVVVAPLLIIGIVLPLAFRLNRRRSNEMLDLVVENAAMAARASG